LCYQLPGIGMSPWLAESICLLQDQLLVCKGKNRHQADAQNEQNGDVQVPLRSV